MILKLLHSYLTGRRQRCNLNGVLSVSKPVDYGVPQGSILGPLLFNLFINNPPLHKFNSRIAIYADNTVFYLRSNNPQNTLTLVREDLLKYYDWCRFNKLSLNIGKTKSLVFSCKVKEERFDKLYLANTFIERVPSYTYLSLILDRKLNYHAHFKKVMATVQDKVYLLSKLRRYIPCFAATIMYKSHLLSYIDYRALFLCGLPINMLQKLQRIQNKCLRICTRAERFTNNFDLRVKCRVLPLRLRRESQMIKYMFNQVRLDISLLTELIRSGNKSVLKWLCKVPLPKSERYKRLVAYSAIIVWNAILDCLRMCNDLRSFKCQLKKFMYSRFCSD